MIKVFIVYYPGAIDKKWADKFLNQQENAQCKLFRSEKREKQFVLGRIIATYALCSLMSVSKKQICFCRDVFGKPYLKGYDDISFNISHSGDYIACAISDSAVGIDIELLRDVYDHGVLEFLADEEQRYLKAIPEQNKCKEFFDIWTKKESYIKMIGKGLSISMRSFSVLSQEDCMYHRILGEAIIIGNVCSKEETQSPEVKYICATELDDYLVNKLWE